MFQIPGTAMFKVKMVKKLLYRQSWIREDKIRLLYPWHLHGRHPNAKKNPSITRKCNRHRRKGLCDRR